MSDSSPQPTCPHCGEAVCHVRVGGEWKLGDWPPVVPVVDFGRMVVAFDGHYSEIQDGEVRPVHTAYDAFHVGAPPAPIIVQLHECNARTRYGGHTTER